MRNFQTYRRGELLEQILFGLVDFVALGRDAERNLFVQLLDVSHVRVGHLLQHLDKVRELRAQYLVHLDAERDERGLRVISSNYYI